MTESIDTPYQLLLQGAANQPSASLWLADESFPIQCAQRLSADTNLFLTNRYDIFHALKANQQPCWFNDFDFKAIEATNVDKVYYRVSKEKAVTHYLINQAYRYLPPGGELHLSGYKGDGIKTYLDKAKVLFGESVYLENGPSTAKYGVLRKTTDNNPALDDKNYEASVIIDAIDNKPIVSKPGVFGWHKKDPGSQLLIDHLDTFLESVKQPIHQILDLGCGYGFISLYGFYASAKLHDANFTLTDNNAAAIYCAQKNITAHGIKGTVIADDAGRNIETTFDIILCNPPFHKGFDVSNALTDHFLESMKLRLNPKGKALVVVNQFVGIEKKAVKYFNKVEELARNKRFKLIVLSKAKR